MAACLAGLRAETAADALKEDVTLQKGRWPQSGALNQSKCVTRNPQPEMEFYG